jgi:predicted signal transduction protein with EAL and GGDEF domain
MVEVMITSLQKPMTLGSSFRISPRASAGLAMLTADISATEAMMRADMAMYAAKRGGKNAYTVYDHAIGSAAGGSQPLADSDEDPRTVLATNAPSPGEH